MNLLKLFPLLWIVSINCTCFLAEAQYFTGPVASGVGGAGVASTEVIETSFLNPAILPHAEEFTSGVFYRDGWDYGLFPTTDLAINLVDNSKGILIPGSIGYVQRRRNFPQALGAVDEKFWHVAIGDFVAEHISMGLSVFQLESATDTAHYQQLNGTLGMMWNPTPEFAIGLVFQNLTHAPAKVPDEVALHTQSTLGFSFIASDFLRFRLDLAKQVRDNPKNKLDIKAGIETYLTGFLVFRLGWNSNQLLRIDQLSVGSSFVGPRFSLDYAYLNSQDDSGRGGMHSVDLSVPF